MKYKSLIISILIVVIPLMGIGQEPEYETIFSKKAMKEFSKIRFYGIVNTAYSPLQKNNKRYDFLNLGLDVGVSYKKQYSFGVFSQSIGEIKEDFRPNYPQRPDLFTSLSNYGLSLAYTQNPQKSLHLLYNLKIGQMEVTELIVQQDTDFIQNYEKSPMVIPSIGVEANMFPWLAVNLNFGYRFVAPKTSLGLQFNRDLRGSLLQFGIKIGNIR
jgi:hypothetical protein